jgi:hypothetical protein
MFLLEHKEKARLALELAQREVSHLSYTHRTFVFLHYWNHLSSLLDGLAFAEKMEWIESAENFISTRKLRNILVHEYLVNAELFLNALQAADKATLMLIDVVNKISQYSKNIDLIN